MKRYEARDHRESENRKTKPRYAFYERGREESRINYNYKLCVHIIFGKLSYILKPGKRRGRVVLFDHNILPEFIS